MNPTCRPILGALITAVAFTSTASAQTTIDMVGKSGIDVFLSNHPNVDSALTKLEAVKARQPGQTNPFVVGTGTVQRFLTVVGECAKAQEATF